MRKRTGWLWGMIPLAVLLLDRWTKVMAQAMTEPVTLIPGVIGLRYSRNTGMAFSLLSGNSWALGILSLAVILGAWLALRPLRLGPWSRTGAMLALGGAVGNMIDRLFAGYVTDMIEVLLFRFAIFNVADAALCCGCVLICIAAIFFPGELERKTDGGQTRGNTAE